MVRLAFDFARALFTIALASESFFGSAFFAGLQVERMALDLFNDVLLLDFTFETAQSTFKSFSLLQMNFCQLKIHHLPEWRGALVRTGPKGYCNAIVVRGNIGVEAAGAVNTGDFWQTKV